SIAAEIPFDNEMNGKLLSLSGRSGMEESLAEEISQIIKKKLTGNDIIIDLPEPVSFECDLFVSDENCFFSAGSSAFKGSLVDALVKSLRIIRIFVAPGNEKK
ncbi:MAG: phosphohydrolase, partial [Treponema sp.]|nr:phosphohydrolase [Treponema sp.]